MKTLHRGTYQIQSGTFFRVLKINLKAQNFLDIQLNNTLRTTL